MQTLVGPRKKRGTVYEVDFRPIERWSPLLRSALAVTPSGTVVARAVRYSESLTAVCNTEK